MSKTKEKPVLMTIFNVRIVQNDDMNVMVERYEESFNNITKEPVWKWRFKGYSSTITSALKLIINKELLVDKTEVSDLNSFLEQLDKLNASLLKAVNQ